MRKFLVEDVKVGIPKGGIACGPVSGSVIAEVCLRDMEEGTVKYYSLAEVEGIPNFIETEVSTFDRQIEDDPDDEEFWNMLSKCCVEGIGDYRDVFDKQEEMKHHDPERLMIWKYLIYIVRTDWEEIDQIKEMSIGKCLGDLEIPVCDIEQDYLDDNADEEIEEDK